MRGTRPFESRLVANTTILGMLDVAPSPPGLPQIAQLLAYFHNLSHNGLKLVGHGVSELIPCLEG